MAHKAAGVKRTSHGAASLTGARPGSYHCAPSATQTRAVPRPGGPGPAGGRRAGPSDPRFSCSPASPAPSSAPPMTASLKGYRAGCRRSTRWSPPCGALRRGAARQDRRVPRAPRRAATRSTTSCPRPSPWCARRPSACSACATSTCSWSAAWCCTSGKIAEMKTGEGKTPGRHPAGLPQRAGRQGRPRRHRQRLPRPPRRRVDGPALRLPRPDRRRHRARAGATRSASDAYAADITYGTNNEFGFDYLRDNMKYRLERHGPARLQLRDRRRGRLAS